MRSDLHQLRAMLDEAQLLIARVSALLGEQGGRGYAAPSARRSRRAARPDRRAAPVEPSADPADAGMTVAKAAAWRRSRGLAEGEPIPPLVELGCDTCGQLFRTRHPERFSECAECRPKAAEQAA